MDGTHEHTPRWTISARGRRVLIAGSLFVIGAFSLLTMLVVALHVSRKPPLTQVLHPETGYTFPDIRDIDSMDILYYSEDLQVGRPRFNIPREHWARILASMTPSQQDRKILKWTVVGFITIRLRSGEATEVHLFDTLPSETGETVGAFAVEANQTVLPFRGGKSDQLKQAIMDAYVASKR